MGEKNNLYENVCIQIHNTTISYDEELQSLINETVNTIYNKVSEKITQTYGASCNSGLLNIVSYSFEKEKTRFKDQYPSLDMENIESRANYENYLNNSETNMDLADFSSKLEEKISNYLYIINTENEAYRRDIFSIKRDINLIISREVETYFLKVSKMSMLMKSSIKSVYDEVIKNYGLTNQVQVSSPLESEPTLESNQLETSNRTL